MKPFLEKLNLTEQQSFYSKTHNTPLFEVGWHQHHELEIIYFNQGHGKAFIGNYIGEFKPGDIFFLGADLPHSFQKEYPDMFVSAIVIQFKEDFWGSCFLQLPECRNLRNVFSKARYGLKLKNSCREELAGEIAELENSDGLTRVIRLINCLQLLSLAQDAEQLASIDLNEPFVLHKSRIELVYRFTMENYFEPITLEQVAAIASMSIPSFCNYFKRCTRKTYIEFLNEMRIEQACKLLIETDKSIHEIGFTSGFNTLPNFNKQFAKVKRMTPSQYRKTFRYNLATG